MIYLIRKVIKPILFCLGLALMIYESVAAASDSPYLYVVALALMITPIPFEQPGTRPKPQPTEWQRKYGNIKPMSSSEYDSFWMRGEMPERFWPKELEHMAQQYSRDEITMQQLEDGCDDIMGLTRMEGYRND